MTSIEDITKSINNSTEIIKIIYPDLLQPAVKNVGITLETLFGFANTLLLPIRLLNEKSKVLFQNHMERYRKKIEHIDDNDITQISVEIGIPILEKLTYIQDFYISEMYLNLLASASSKKTIEFAHPSFIKIIESLSSDEAKIILYLTTKLFEYNDRIIRYIYYEGYSEIDKKRFKTSINLTGLEIFSNIIYKKNIQIYLDNFVGLGLLVDNDSKTFPDSYDELIEIYKLPQEQIDEYNKAKISIKLRKHYYNITDYGLLFLKSCSSTFYNLLTKGENCIITYNYSEAIQYYEELIKYNFIYSAVLVNLLELYLITKNISQYEKLYTEYQSIIEKNINITLRKYLIILHAFFTNKFDKMKEEIKSCMNINEKIIFSYEQILFTLKNVPDDKNKKILEYFIKYLKKEIESKDLLIILDND